LALVGAPSTSFRPRLMQVILKPSAIRTADADSVTFLP
jgi:hypothetical protein